MLTVTEGQTVKLYVQQSERSVEILKIYRMRARIRYSLPSGRCVEGFWPGQWRNGSFVLHHSRS
jgi:hypothetical protein